MIRVGQWVLLQKEIASTCLWPYRPCTGAPERGLPNGLSHKPTAEVHVPHRHSKMRSAIGTLGGRSRSLPSQPHSAGPLKAYRVSPFELPPPSGRRLARPRKPQAFLLMRQTTLVSPPISN